MKAKRANPKLGVEIHLTVAPHANTNRKRERKKNVSIATKNKTSTDAVFVV